MFGSSLELHEFPSLHFYSFFSQRLIVRSNLFIIFYNSLLPVGSIQHLRIGEFIYSLYVLTQVQDLTKHDISHNESSARGRSMLREGGRERR